MKENRFVLIYFYINLITINTNLIQSQNYLNNIYNNFIDYSYKKNHCFINDNSNAISRNLEYCKKVQRQKKKKKKKQKIVKNLQMKH